MCVLAVSAARMDGLQGLHFEDDLAEVLKMCSLIGSRLLVLKGPNYVESGLCHTAV